MEIDELEMIQMKKDFQYFLDNIPHLYAKYGDSYVAIKNETVLGNYTSISEAITSTAKTERMGTFIVQQCVPDSSYVVAHFAGNVCI